MQAKRCCFPVFLALWALAAGAGPFACSRSNGNPPEKITLAFATPPSTALADIAQAQGFFLQEGLAVTPSFHTSGKAALDEVLEGKADVATVAETPFMFAVMNGHPVSIIASIQKSAKNDVLYARRDKGISSPRDLAGKRIGVPLGTGAEFYLDTFLLARNISRREVIVVNLAPEKMASALAKGDVDAISAWPPFLARAQKELGDRGVAFNDEDIYTQTFNLVATREYIRMNPGKVKKMLRALIRAEASLARDPDEALRAVAGFRRVDTTALNSMWDSSAYTVTLDQSLLFTLEDESRWAMKRGLTVKKTLPDYLDHIDLESLAAVRQGAVRIVK
jgi:sulfonate transport system substrate-binding protein